MERFPVPLSLPRKIVYASGSFAFTLLERMLIFYTAFYYLPPEEAGLPDLLSGRTFGGFFTVLGVALLLGRVVDGLADPVIASWSDRSRSRLGRRKTFLLAGSPFLALSTVLIFYPPHPGGESILNALWLSAVMGAFYLFFTAYVNPYLALLSELGHTGKERINLSTAMALFGLLGIVAVTVLFPEAVSRLPQESLSFRQAYQVVAAGMAICSFLILIAVSLSFDEKKHCRPVSPPRANFFHSLLDTYRVRPFRIFLAGEVFLQFAMNLITLGMIYYAVVLFQRDQRFMTVLSGAALITALACFPLVNTTAKRAGKKKVILTGVLILAIVSLALFFLGNHLAGAAFYPGVALFALAGIPLAVLTILVNPTVAELAREDACRTGQNREAMFFGARAIPLKLTIALAGATFAFLLSAFGKDVASPLGVRLSILLVALACLGGFFFFHRYPEDSVRRALRLYEPEP